MEVINAKTLSKISDDYNTERYGIKIIIKEILEKCLKSAKKGGNHIDYQIDENFNREARLVLLDKLQELGFITESNGLKGQYTTIKW